MGSPQAKGAAISTFGNGQGLTALHVLSVHGRSPGQSVSDEGYDRPNSRVARRYQSAVLPSIGSLEYRS